MDTDRGDRIRQALEATGPLTGPGLMFTSVPSPDTPAQLAE